MCGRAVQTRRALRAAARSLGNARGRSTRTTASHQRHSAALHGSSTTASTLGSTPANTPPSSSIACTSSASKGTQQSCGGVHADICMTSCEASSAPPIDDGADDADDAAMTKDHNVSVDSSASNVAPKPLDVISLDEATSMSPSPSKTTTAASFTDGIFSNIDQTPEDPKRQQQQQQQQQQQWCEDGEEKGGWHDSYNMSPGMDALVFTRSKDQPRELEASLKSWGLLTKAGTLQNPLPPKDDTKRMGIQFSNLMYNARSDTLYQKPTFARLASQGRACLVVLDGYYEWKGPSLKGQRKQPYFMYGKWDNDKDQDVPTPRTAASSPSSFQAPEQQPRPANSYFVLAGLWNRVATGIPEEPWADTFTILTTKANKQIEWMHHRMPVSIWDMSLALQWLENPTSEELLRQLEYQAAIQQNRFGWHMVTPDMSSVSFQDKRAIQPIPKPRSVASFFRTIPKSTQKGDAKVKTSTSAKKRAAEASATTMTSASDLKKSRQRPKKGSIASFFQPKRSQTS